MLNYDYQTDEEDGVEMMNLKDMCIKILCQAGKYGVNKSVMFDGYKLEVPKKLKCCEKNEYGHCKRSKVRNKISILMILLTVLLFGACADKKSDDTDLNFPKLNWGMSREEVMEAGGIAEEDLESYGDEMQYSSSYIIEGYKVFGEKSDRTRFEMLDLGNGTKGLANVIVEYPDSADMDRVLKEMKKAYGATVPEIIRYDMMSMMGMDDSLPEVQYTESDNVKIWAGNSVNEVIPKGQEDAYKKLWQEKPYPSATVPFQTGLSDDTWEEFSKNAKMVMVLWLKDGQEIFDSGNKLYFGALTQNVYNEITRRISEQK